MLVRKIVTARRKRFPSRVSKARQYILTIENLTDPADRHVHDGVRTLIP